MDKIEKKQIIQKISETLIDYDIKYQGHFLCPLCFRLIPVDHLEQISIAHILPQAAGGKITTWLCKNCNSKLGTKIDKWFGEYLTAITKKSIFDDQITKKGFLIDGIELHGFIRQKDNGINLLIDPKRNSPKIMGKVKNEFAVYKEKRKFSIEIPLLGKDDAVNIGFITAAYLYGFSIFGYSWVMQSQFDSLRESILEYKKPQINGAFISTIVTDDDDREQWFGIATINKIYIPCIKILSKVVFFEPAYSGNCLNYIKEQKEIFNVDIKRLGNIKNQTYTKPFILTVGNNVLIYPDKGKNKVPISFVILVRENDFQVKILSTFVDANFEKNNSDVLLEKYSINLSELRK